MSWAERKRGRGQGFGGAANDNDDSIRGFGSPDRVPDSPASAFGAGPRRRSGNNSNTSSDRLGLRDSPRSQTSQDSAARPPGSMASSGSDDGVGMSNPTASGDQARVDIGDTDDQKGVPGDAPDGAGGGGRADNARRLQRAASGGVNHSLARSRNKRLERFVMKGPLAGQPVERPRDPRFTWARLFSLISVVLLALYTILSFQAVCLLKDVCFRTDPAVVTLGSLTALPFTAAVLLVLVPIGFVAAYYRLRVLMIVYIVVAALIAALLLLGASFSWHESSDTASTDHANAEWSSLSYNDKLYFNNNVVEMADSYQDSALMFGFVAFVGFVIIALSSCTLLCFCVVLTSPELCGRQPANSLPR